MIRKRLRSTLSASRPPTMGSTSVGPELGEDDDADERGRVREVVGVGAEDDVLHPGADVRGEGTQEDDAEGAVRQGRPGGAAPGRDGAVPVDDRVLDLLEGDGAVAARPDPVPDASESAGTGPSYGTAPAHRTGGPAAPLVGSGARRRADGPTGDAEGRHRRQRHRQRPTPRRRCVAPGRCRRTSAALAPATGTGAACPRS